MKVFHILTQTNSHISNRDIRIFLGIWAGIFCLIALFPLIKAFELHAIRTYPLIASILSYIFMLIPRTVIPLYRTWIFFGEILGFLISRTILSILFFGIFSPIAIFFRLIGRDVLRQKLDKSVTSYFIHRKNKPESMKYQF